MQRRPIFAGLLCLVLTACGPSTAAPTPTSELPSALPSLEAAVATSPAPLSPAQTPTPVPALRAFTEDFSGTLDQWAFFQVENGVSAPDPRTSAGYLRFDLTAGNQWVYATYDPQSYEDVRVDAFVTDGGAGSAVGVICRYSQGGGWYEFDVHPDQTYVLLYGQWLAPGVARFTPIVRSQSEKIQPNENELGLQCQGNILTPYINGVQMRQRVENRYALTSGKVGVTAASSEGAPMSILIDWVKVAEP